MLTIVYEIVKKLLIKPWVNTSENRNIIYLLLIQKINLKLKLIDKSL